MLKTLKASLFVAVASAALAAPAHAGVEEDLANICTIVKADDKGELRKKMRTVQSKYRLKLKDFYSGVTCGGQSLIRTAMLNEAVESGTLLVKKLPKSTLSSPEADGKTLTDWASEQGLVDSPIGNVLKNRI